MTTVRTEPSEPAPQYAHEQIATALELERLDVDLFRSKTLWLPARARGVFGGQVISQAIVSATNSVDPAYGLHVIISLSTLFSALTTLCSLSMQVCYFLLSASASTPIIYYVERLRDGRSYLTRSVKATQNGRVVFMMMCSFQKPEPWQPSRAWGMPRVPPPEECRLEEERYEEWIRAEGTHPKVVQRLKEYSNDRRMSPIAIKLAVERETSMPGIVRTCYWMQARDIPEYDAPFQKCILGYISDHHLLSAATQALGLQRFGRGPKATSMTSTIDHSICFYDDTFDCGDWLLYVMCSPAAGSGRGIVYGQMYTREGKLVAATTQEGGRSSGYSGTGGSDEGEALVDILINIISDSLR
ncbi:DNA repair protein RAD14 [Mycena sanguinolenta]|uniref:DNA repair protein RAD14 n=1 Tax=Mycena sanguinolenta TaxID=230812 RepID=A0A8H6XFZ9_9AGAR|nr:DNA repair protein RAD14 [Mycena sanguinolenta]